MIKCFKVTPKLTLKKGSYYLQEAQFPQLTNNEQDNADSSKK